MDSSLLPVAIKAATTLRATGKTVDLQLEARKPKWVFKHADRLSASYVVLVGPDEAKEGKVVVKDMVTGEQSTLSIDDLGGFVTTASSSSTSASGGGGSSSSG